MLESIFNWMNTNLLTVNPDKSTSIPISHNSKKKNFSINVTYNDVPIENVSSSKYLGLILDQNLTFVEQIKMIETKVSRASGVISKIKPFLPAKTLISLYCSLLHLPLLTFTHFLLIYYSLLHLLYEIVIWASTFDTYKQKLRALQNSHPNNHKRKIYRFLESIVF